MVIGDRLGVGRDVGYIVRVIVYTFDYYIFVIIVIIIIYCVLFVVEVIFLTRMSRFKDGDVIIFIELT